MVAVLIAACAATASLHAAFTSSKSTQQTIKAVPDFLPPAVSSAQIDGPGDLVGAVRPGLSYRVCA